MAAAPKNNRRFFLVSVCPACGLDLTKGLIIRGEAEEHSTQMSEGGEVLAPSGYAECICGCWLDDYIVAQPARPKKLTYRKAVEAGEYPPGDVGGLAKGLINYVVTSHFLQLLNGDLDSVEKVIDDSFEKMKESVKGWRKRFEDRCISQTAKQELKKK